MGGLQGSNWHDMMLKKYKTEEGIRAEMSRRSLLNEKHGLSGEEWTQMMLKKFKTEEGIKAEMQRRSKESIGVKRPGAGFASMDKETLREIGRAHGRGKGVSNDTRQL